MIILAFGNKARHGKDTAAEAVKDFYDRQYDKATRHGLECRIKTVLHLKFADALYHECRTLHGMTVKDAPLLQKVGSDRRKENLNYWVEKVFAIIPHGPGLTVISDLRYQNEAQAVKERNGVTISVSRLNQNGTPFVADDRPADHPSEIDLDGYNFDHRIIAKTGEAALVGEQAVTLAEYIVALQR